MRMAAPIASAALLFACAPQAEQNEQDRTGTTHGAMGASTSPGDPDRSFARGMIPHHHDAVQMAEEELRLGRDPELRALAAKIIKDQQSEIEQLERWLAKVENGGSRQ